MPELTRFGKRVGLHYTRFGKSSLVASIGYGAPWPLFRRNQPRTAKVRLRALAISERETERRIQKEVLPGEEAYRLGDYEAALAHLRPLADEGNPSACYYLGQLYERGAGVPQDYIKAYCLFDHAVIFEAPYPANEAKARISKLMSPEELKRAKRIAEGGVRSPR